MYAKIRGVRPPVRSALGWLCEPGLGRWCGRRRPPTGVPPKVPAAMVWGADDRLCVALRGARRLITVDPRAGGSLPNGPCRSALVSLALDEIRSTFFVGGAEGEALVLNREGALVRTLPSGKGPTRIPPAPRRAGGHWITLGRGGQGRGLESRKVEATHRLPSLSVRWCERPRGG